MVMGLLHLHTKFHMPSLHDLLIITI